MRVPASLGKPHGRNARCSTEIARSGKRGTPLLDILWQNSRKSGGPAARLELRGRVCKWPVSRILSRTIIPLGDALLRALKRPTRRFRRDRAGERAGPARIQPGSAADSLPIWSCSVWGLPCHRLYRRRGALLPHLFTLTPALQPEAVCSLWHWPSLGLDAQIPDVIRHTALRSSDFPPRSTRALRQRPPSAPAIPMLVHLAGFVCSRKLSSWRR